jgi:hypothetical protein
MGHLLLSGLEWVEKLAALVPPPRIHLTRFFGCLAPHAKIRSAIVPKKEEIEVATAEPAEARAADHPKKKQRKGWAELLARVFAIDMSHCPKCGGEFKVIAAILETMAIKKILTHLNIPYQPPDIPPARISTQTIFA